MTLAPDREPITRPVLIWLEVVTQLATHRDGSLAAAMQQAMEGWRIGDTATFTPTVEEQLRVNAVLREWLGEQDPE